METEFVDFCLKYQQYPLLLITYNLNYKFRRHINQSLDVKMLLESIDKINSLITKKYDQFSYKRRLIKKSLPIQSGYSYIRFIKNDVLYKNYEYSLFLAIYYHCPHPDIVIRHYKDVMNDIIKSVSKESNLGSNLRTISRSNQSLDQISDQILDEMSNLGPNLSLKSDLKEDLGADLGADLVEDLGEDLEKDLKKDLENLKDLDDLDDLDDNSEDSLEESEDSKEGSKKDLGDIPDCFLGPIYNTTPDFLLSEFENDESIHLFTYKGDNVYFNTKSLEYNTESGKSADFLGFIF